MAGSVYRAFCTLKGMSMNQPSLAEILFFVPVAPPNQQIRFETKQVLAYIRSLGLKIDDNHIDYLVKHGVIGLRSIRGKGRGGSVIGSWSLPQRELLREVLTLEQCYHAKLADMCVLPVAKWIYWGETADIDLLQVKRAMYTWAKYHRFPRRRSFKRAECDAANFLRTIGHASAVEKRKVAEQLAEISYNWEYPDEAALYDLLRPIIDPDMKGEAKGPQGASFSPEAASHLITARVTAIDAVLSNGRISDSLWEWARVFFLFNYRQYQEQQPDFYTQVAKTSVAHLFEADTLSSLCSTACHELATIIGIGLLHPVLPHIPACWHPQTWEQGGKKAHVTARPVPSCLLGPDGRPFFHLQTEVSFSGQL